MDFFGDDLETIKEFDPSTQRALQRLESVNIAPAREYLLPANLPEDLAGKPISESVIPRFHPFGASLFDYLPKDTLVKLMKLGARVARFVGG